MFVPGFCGRSQARFLQNIGSPAGCHTRSNQEILQKAEVRSAFGCKTPPLWLSHVCLFRHSLANHPDKHPGDEAKARVFADIKRAYEVLSDEETRSTYDLDGEEGLEREKQQPQQWNPFGSMFGGGGQGGGKPKGQTMTSDHEVTLQGALAFTYFNYTCSRASPLHMPVSLRVFLFLIFRCVSTHVFESYLRRASSLYISVSLRVFYY